MPVLRKVPVWIVLASYLFANTIASSLHDHGDCCSRSEGVQHDTTDCSKTSFNREEGKHCCHQHHNHGHKQVAATRQNQGPSRNPAEPRSGRDQNGGSRHDSRHCVVCDFLALAPLAAPQAALVAAAEVLPEFVVLDVLPVFGATVETHLARGPPAA